MSGETNKHFFRQLREAGITAEKIPTISFCIGEPEIKEWGAALMAGDYASWSYFQSVESSENAKFIAAFRQRFGQDRVLSDPMETAYFSVYVWSQVVNLVGTADPEHVLAFIQNQSRVVPEGIISVDAFNHNAWRVARVGQVGDAGQFDIRWSSEKAVYPVPYLFKSRDEWNSILHELYTGWGGSWAKKA